MSLQELNPNGTGVVSEQNPTPIAKEKVSEAEISFGPEDVVELPNKLSAKIADIEITTAGELFGEKTKSPADQKVFKVLAINEEFGKAIDFPITYYEKAKIPKKSKLGKIIGQYGSFKIGTELEFAKNSDGYYKLVLV
jgi:hypothetical protein